MILFLLDEVKMTYALSPCIPGIKVPVEETLKSIIVDFPCPQLLDEEGIRFDK